jgi:hypothetical protein
MTAPFQVWPKAPSFDRGPQQVEIPLQRLAEGMAFVRQNKFDSMLLTSLEPPGSAQLIDFGFLDELADLSGFECSVNVSRKSDLGPLFRLTKLKQLGWFGRTVPPFDLSHFPALECLAIKHQATTTGWDALSRLEYLRLSLSDETDLQVLKRLTALTRLEVSDSPIESMAGIEQMDTLERIDLFNLPKLTDISAIAECRKLKVLYVHNTKQLTDFSALGASKSLERLRLFTPTASVDFVPTIKTLKDFFCKGITPDDLAPLLLATSLESLDMQPRKRSHIPSIDDIRKTLGIR